MKRLIPFLILCFLGLISEVVFGQQLPINDQFYINKYSVSPAYAGYNKNVEAFLGMRQDYVGFEGAPEKQIVNMHGPVGETAGLGGFFIHEKTGNFSHFYSSIAYAYHLEMSKTRFISMGVGAEIYRNQISGSAVTPYGTDPIIMKQEVINGTSFNASFGAVARMDGFNIGIVVPRLLESKINYIEDNKYTMAREFRVHVSYLVQKRRSDWIFEPFAQFRTVPNRGSIIEAAILTRFRERVWASAMYRSGGFGFGIGAALSNRILMNYTYQLGGSGLMGLSNGSHEIGLGFLVKSPKRGGGPSMFPESEEQSIAKDLRKKLTETRNELAKEIAASKQSVDSLAQKVAELEKRKPEPVAQQQEESKEEEGYGKPVALKNIKFGNNSDRLFASSYPNLNKLAAIMMREPKLKILIVGHTDNVGSSKYNQKLSEKRAEAIKRYLVEKRRISEDRIKTMGKGESVPIADNSTPAGQQQNRRIEIRMKKK